MIESLQEQNDTLLKQNYELEAIIESHKAMIHQLRQKVAETNQKLVRMTDFNEDSFNALKQQLSQKDAHIKKLQNEIQMLHSKQQLQEHNWKQVCDTLYYNTIIAEYSCLLYRNLIQSQLM